MDLNQDFDEFLLDMEVAMIMTKADREEGTFREIPFCGQLDADKVFFKPVAVSLDQPEPVKLLTDKKPLCQVQSDQEDLPLDLTNYRKKEEEDDTEEETLEEAVGNFPLDLTNYHKKEEEAMEEEEEHGEEVEDEAEKDEIIIQQASPPSSPIFQDHLSGEEPDHREGTVSPWRWAEAWIVNRNSLGHLNNDQDIEITEDSPEEEEFDLSWEDYPEEESTEEDSENDQEEETNCLNESIQFVPYHPFSYVHSRTERSSQEFSR
jgi:hypothetical protein